MKTIKLTKECDEIMSIIINTCLITKEPVKVIDICKDDEQKGLNKKIISRLKNLIENNLLKAEGNQTGSEEITIYPTENSIPKTINIDCENCSIDEIIKDILPLILFQEKRKLINIKSKTHEENKASITILKEIVFRLLKNLTNQIKIQVPQIGIDKNIGEINLEIEPKKTQKDKELNQIKIIPKTKLITIKIELIANDEKELIHLEKIIHLSLQTKKLTHTINTRLTEENSTIITAIAFFGNEEGFDNDKPFLKGYETIINNNFKDEETINFLKEFEEKIKQKELDEISNKIIIPIMGFVGGEIPLTNTNPKINSVIKTIEELLNIKFEFKDNKLFCEGYFQKQKNEEEIINIDEL